MLATQPFSKVMRAFAMSSEFESTLTPTASTCFTGERQVLGQPNIVNHEIEHHPNFRATRVKGASLSAVINCGSMTAFSKNPITGL